MFGFGEKKDNNSNGKPVVKINTFKETKEIVTIIGVETQIQGTIRTKGSIRIDGKVEGSIDEAAGVIIGPTGQIHGDVAATSVVVGGKVTGNVTAHETLELQPKAHVYGDIHSPQHGLTIAPGAIFEGNCVMTSEKNKIIEMDLKDLKGNVKERV